MTSLPGGDDWREAELRARCDAALREAHRQHFATLGITAAAREIAHRAHRLQVTVLRHEAKPPQPADPSALQQWQVETYPQVSELIREGFRRQDVTSAGMCDWMARVDVAYARQEVRDAGPLDVTWPVQGTHGPRRLPRVLFPLWGRA
ncbi:MAG: hypothetical protein ACRYHQ_24155 [Janthinobacterium lividum]